jgi:tRNA (mo5U34)-methyltransferase
MKDPAIEQRRAQVATLGPWFHNLHLSDGLQTAPDHFLGPDFPHFKWRQVAPALPQRLDGWSALDIGCNAGFYSFELARRGATVLGVDVDARYLAQARFAAADYGLQDQVRFMQAQVYELAQLRQTFDLVWFMGVFYHLRYPLLALDILAAKTRRLMVFQTLTMPGDEVSAVDANALALHERAPLLHSGWPKMAFFENGFAGDPTNWWAPNHAAVEAMLRSSGLRVSARPGHEIYVCEPDAQQMGRRERFDDQLRSALTQRQSA